jgi:tetratricopeptide (TPR) repeat protein
MRAWAFAGLSAEVLLLAACGGSGAPPGPSVSPTGIVYELGTPPTETRNSQTAALYLRQNLEDRALEQALEGVALAPDNPIHYFLAGVAYARLREYARADSMFTTAQRIYPAYELDIEPEREAAWGGAFNAGLVAYEDGDVDATIAVWTGATHIYDLRPEAHRNLGSLLSAEGRFPEAIDAYFDALAGLDRRPATRLLSDEDLLAREAARMEIERDLSELLLATDRFVEAEPILRRRVERDPENADLRADLAAALAGLGRDDEAREIYTALLSEEGLALTQVFSLGVGLFRSGQYLPAAAAFRRVTELQPESRDGWFNYANSLFAAQAWDSLAVAGSRLVELDPLGENAHLMTARARLELGDRQGALASLDRADQTPVHVEDLQMRRSGTAVSVHGRITGNAADPGAPITLRFTFFGEAAAFLGTETVTLPAPAMAETATFEVPFSMDAYAYRYEIVP